MMQKRVNMSVPGIKARTGGRVGKRMPSTEPPPIVLTIGHSTRTLEEFIRLLQAHGATRVVDVRTVPRSRHNPQFNKTSLPRALKKVGLGYVHLPGLGGLRHAKRDSLNVGWRNASFRGYADYMQTPEFAQSLEELIRLAKQERIAIMCAEAVPWRCHRSLIADALLDRRFPLRAEAEWDTYTCRDSAACAMRSAIHSMWAGEMSPFGVTRITCRRQNVNRASKN